MSSIPEEIYIEILSRLPVKSTLVCKCVCKKWYDLISNPSFVKMHHKLTIQRTNFRLMISGFDNRMSRNVICSLSCDPSSFTSDEFHLYGLEIDRPLDSGGSLELMGWCNGWVCIWSRWKKLFSLWNPDSREYKELPKLPNKSVNRINFTYAFGYDSSTCDYKLIRLYANYDGPGSSIDVYSMRLNSWKNTQVVPYEMDLWSHGGSGVLANGVFHWIGVSIDFGYTCIFSLDISNEKCNDLQPPNDPSVNHPFSSMNLGSLRECLCLLVIDDGLTIFEVWVMQDYGVQESWTRHYTITHDTILKHHYYLRCLWSYDSGEILFASGVGSGTDLVLYDPKDGSARKVNIHISGRDTSDYLQSCIVPLDFSSYVG